MVPDNLSPDFIWDKNKDQLNQNFWDKRQLLLIFVIVKKKQHHPSRRIFIKDISSFAVFWPSPCQSKLLLAAATT